MSGISLASEKVALLVLLLLNLAQLCLSFVSHRGRPFPLINVREQQRRTCLERGRASSKTWAKRKKLTKGGSPSPDDDEGYLKLGKLAGKESLKAAKVLVEGLVEQVSPDSKRDMGAISESFAQLRRLADDFRPVTSTYLQADWRVVFVNEDDALSAVGTGLHKLPLIRMEEMFMTFRTSPTGGKDQVETTEIMRVLGPFPNLRNKLSGDYSVSAPTTLKLTYDSLIDGTGKTTSGAKSTRRVKVEVLFAGKDYLVLLAEEDKQLLLKREIDMEAVMQSLRVAET